MKLNSNSILYFVAPASHYTGGPESIHRLAYMLRNRFLLDARLLYLPASDEDPVHINFKAFNIPYVNKVEDDQNNIIIVPDYYKHLKILNEYKHIRKIIWWLSVDFFYSSYFIESASNFQLFIFKFISRLNKIMHLLFPNLFQIYDHPRLCMKFLRNLKIKLIPAIRMANLHLAQSEYAYQFLKINGINNVKINNDFLGDDVLNKIHTHKRENIVTYNPAKGYFFTKKIIAACPEIKFVPIVNLSRVDVINLLSRSKVYIDFGNHPGRDRLPREAAFLGNCIVTSVRGSAKFYEDVSIPDDCKFDDISENIMLIKNKIINLLDNYDDEYSRLAEYVHTIKNGETIAAVQIKTIFNLAS